MRSTGWLSVFVLGASVLFLRSSQIAIASPADDDRRSTSMSSTCDSSLPDNLDVGPFQAYAVQMLQRSDTFRRQCQRLAASMVTRVKIELHPRRSDLERASAVVRKYEAGAIRVDVQIRFAGNYVELIAHELEHVLEQVEGIDLEAERRAGRAVQVGSGAFETDRAAAAGRKVWAEVSQYGGARGAGSRAVAPAAR